MALPVVVAVRILPLLLAAAKYISAVFNVASSFYRAVVAWFFAHKILFSLFCAGVWVALWYGIVSFFYWFAGSYVSGIIWAAAPDIQVLKSGFALLSEFVSFSAFRRTLVIFFALSTGELVVLTSWRASRLVFEFFKTLSNTFHG